MHCIIVIRNKLNEVVFNCFKFHLFTLMFRLLHSCVVVYYFHFYRMTHEERKDKLTGEPFLPKRINQYFISAANRIKYYNDKANQLRHNAAFVNRPLHDNLRILDELMSNEKEVNLHKQFLAGRGFSFFVHTHYEEYEGRMEIALYHYIIIKINDEHLKIIRK